MIVIDARELEPPEPFERVMEALSDLQQGDRIVLILNREPFPLYRVLERNGYAYAPKSFPDGRFEIEIWQK
ncbi:MAG: DUF2249 domain-containing protein [Burkholderiales bacterium]|nr:DUF2249 domain-containing protein [Burkholderiales bacterium]